MTVNPNTATNTTTGKEVPKEFLPFHGMEMVMHINSMGQISPCANKPVVEDEHIFNMSVPNPFKKLRRECPKCKNITDVEVFL